jgi:hypothetical protein
MMIHTKLKRLFRTVAERNGTLTSQKALAEAMALTQPAVTQLFGYGQDKAPLNQPSVRLGQLIRLFREAGIPIEMHWLEVPLNEFDRLLRQNTGIDVRPSLNWMDAVRRHARSYDGLRLRRPAPGGGYRLRLEGEPAAPPLDRFHVDERVYLALDLSETFLDWEGTVFATVVHEAPHEIACLFPLEGVDSGSITGKALRLPEAQDRHYQVSGPAGVQRVHTVISRFRPAVSVHAGLADIDLHLGLDRLVSELSQRPVDSWGLLSLTYQVVEPGTPTDRDLLVAGSRG